MTDVSAVLTECSDSGRVAFVDRDSGIYECVNRNVNRCASDDLSSNWAAYGFRYMYRYRSDMPFRCMQWATYPDSSSSNSYMLGDYCLAENRYFYKGYNGEDIYDCLHDEHELLRRAKID